MASPSPAVGVALRAVLLVGVVLAIIQLSGAAQPVDLAGAGQDGDGGRVMVEDFGVENVPDVLPFDGQYLYVTARLLPDWDAINDELVESSFRLVRILHPLLASPGGSGNPVLLLMQAWNLVGLGLLAWALADLLGRYGHRRSWAMAAAPACTVSMLFTTSEPLAFGLAMAGVALADRHRLLGATVLLALGGLTRESALTCAAAVAALLWTRHRRPQAVALFVGAVAPTAGWWAYVQSVTPSSRIPLELLGILEIGDQWAVDIVAAVLALILIAVSVAAWWDVPPLRWVTLGFAAWLPIYESFAFRLVGLPRLSMVSIALGIAGLLRWGSEGSARLRPRPVEEHRPQVAG